MPYHISGKGDGLGCKDGYAVINSNNGKVVGCHPTRSDAEKQLAALHINVMDAKADDNPLNTYPGVGIKRPSQGMATTSGGKSKDVTTGRVKSKYGKKPRKVRRGRNSDNLPSNGAVGTNGSTSMGTL